MRLGHTTKYALEAMAFLIRSHARDEWGQIGDIAASCGIPRKYLEQVLLDLKAAGLVESKKGQHGGYRLSRGPDEISLAEVVFAVQGELLPLPEWLPEPRRTTSAATKAAASSANGSAVAGSAVAGSALADISGLREVVEQARNAVQRVFEATSIEVLVCRPDPWRGDQMG